MENGILSHVSIVDIKIPFWSMVIFLVKLAIAAIPAMIILGAIGVMLSAVLGGIVQGIGGH